MYARNSDNYETYYEHLCSIVSEKDILDIDIRGSGYMMRLKRFWHDLFLLSYKNNRSRRYYSSSHAMKVARATHFRHHRSCIHPLSKFRNFWDYLILHVMLINRILFHYNTSIIHNPHIACHYVAVALEAIIMIDLYVNAKTGYHVNDTQKIIIDGRKILIHYLSSTIFVHVASAIPFESIMLLRCGDEINSSSCKCNKFVAVIKMISLISTIRLFQVSTVWNRERNSFHITSFFKFLRIFVLGMVIMLEILTFSDALSILYIVNKKKLDHRTFYSMLMKYKYNSDKKDTAILFLSLEFSRVCKSFLLFGYGLEPKETSFDQLVAIVSFSLAYSFHLWSFLSCYVGIARDVFSEERIILSQTCAMNILRTRQLSDAINTKIREYYQCNMAAMAVTETQNGLYMALPPVLKDDMKLSCYRGQLMRIPFFAEWPFEVINALVLLLNVEVYLAKDIVASAWSRSDGLLIVAEGILAVYSVTMEETGHLIDGDYFGELSLVTDKEMRMSTVIAVTCCKILFLDKSHFRRIMRNYPKLYFETRQNFKDLYGAGEAEMTL